MPNDSYEFGFISKVEKRKVIVSKTLLILLMTYCFVGLIADDTSTMSSNFIKVSGILCAIFGYINLINVKSELMELFEPPYEYTGYEFLAAGFLLNLISWFI